MYADAVAALAAPPPALLLIVNGTLGERVVLELATEGGGRELEVRDCQGVVVRTESVDLAPCLHRIDVPPAGLATLRAVA